MADRMIFSCAKQNLYNALRLSVALGLGTVAWCLTKTAEGLAWTSGRIWRAGDWVMRE
jgi:hypothetical protein